MKLKALLSLLLAVLFCGVLLTYGITQEVPIGRFDGTITMKENAKPLPGALVTVSMIGVPNDEAAPRPHGLETDENGHFSFRNLAAGTYDITVSAKEHHLSQTRVEVLEGKSQHQDLVAEPVDPYLNLYASQKVFTPGETPKIELHGFLPKPNVKIVIYRLDMDDVAKKGGFQEALSPLARPDAPERAKLDRAGNKIADLSHEVKKVDAEGAFVETLPVGQLKEGVYFVGCNAGDSRASTVLNVSKLALVTKTGKDGTLCYTTDLLTGKPVSGADLYVRDGDRMRRAGQTGRDGLASLKISTGDNNQSAIIARQGTSTALVGFYLNGNTGKSTWIGGYCERPAYRPGDTVFFKGFVRKTTEDGYRLPGTGDAQIEIRDPDGNPLQKMSLPISVHGSFNGSFETSPESKPGSYNVVCKAMGAESENIYANVVAYRKPEFSIEVKPKRDFYVLGDKAQAVIECKYYYGGPVVGAKVKATVYRSPVYSYEADDGEQEDVDSYGGGDYSESVEAVTDDSGRATIDFDTKGDNDPDTFTNDYSYTVSASVTEDGGKYFDGEGQVRVVRGAHDLDIEIQNPIVTVGQTLDLLVKTTNPIDSKKPVPNQEVIIEAGREEWTRNSSVFIAKERYTVRTGMDGTVHVNVPVTREESISFRATSKDDDGHSIVADAYAYVEGSPALADGQKGDLKVTLDKRSYESTDKARALIQTDMPGGTALVTLQTDRVLWRQLVPLAKESTMVAMPLRREFAPDVYVSVAYVKEKRFLQAEKRLKVSREDRTLKVEVKSDRDVYKPGDTAQVTVRTTDADGKPVPAEVSVGVVDRGIYDVAKDDTNLYAALYPERWNSVNTSYSFPEIYLDGGDKGSSKIPIRNNFKDTAQWNPAVWTGASGETTVPVTLPDNLTEWRVTAVGLSDTSQAGIATEAFRAKKDLMLRLQLPQYLIDGDHQRMTVVVANDTGKDADVHVDLTSSGLTLDGNLKQTVRVPAGIPQTVEFNAVAGDPGDAKVTAKAWIDNGPNDGVEQGFPIHPHGRPVLATRSGEGALDVSLAPGGKLDPKFGSLKVTVSPTLAGDLTKSLNELIDFPYGCVEQTMSRFMPSVLVEHTVKGLGLPEPNNLRNLPKIVRDSLARLAKMRHGDGGWGWWEWDDTDPFMTALVLDGLDRAKQAGYDVSAAQPEQAVKWGMTRLKDASKKDSLRDRLYLSYSLLRWGEKDAVDILRGLNLKDHETKDWTGRKITLPQTAELATAVLAYHEAGMASEASEALDRLVTRATVGEEQVSWPSEEGAWGAEPTALALVAFETVRPNDPLTPRIVQGLMRSRKGDMWWSTRDTAYSLVGLTAYLENSHELANASDVTVVVNGQTKGTIHLDPQVLDDPSRIIEIPRAELGDGPAKVEIRPNGQGKCYYTVAYQALDVSPELAETSTDAGLKVERSYYKLEPRALENGTKRLLPSAKPITSYENGDLVRVELTIHSDRPREFVLIEEPTPSSCRVTERTEISPEEEWSWWWSRTVMMDDHLAFFARHVPKGDSKISYNMRAEQAGEARALPTTVKNMYDPGRWASTAETTVEVAK